MSADGASSQPPAVASEKAQAPKAPTTFSAFINKNTSGKKFAPKAARRRPGATAATAATAAKPAPGTTTPAAEPQPQTSQTQPEPTTTPAAESQTTPQLPTPAATQEPSVSVTIQREQDVSGLSTSNAEASSATQPPSAGLESLPVAVSTDTEATRGWEEELEPSRSPKRRRVEPSEEGRSTRAFREAVAAVPPTSTQDTASSTQATRAHLEPATAPATAQPTENGIQGAQAEVTIPMESTTRTTETARHDDGTGEIEMSDTELSNHQKRPQRQKAGWTAVNEQQTEDAEPSASTRRTRQSAKPRGVQKTTTAGADDEVHAEGEEENRAAPKRPSAKGRGKRKATDATAEDGGEANEPPAKKPRKPRKRKVRNESQEVGGNEAVGEDGVVSEEAGGRRKKGRKKKVIQKAEGEGEGQGVQQSKRKGRPPREATPSDAEDHEIDPENTFMDNIASRNIRVGRLSEREKKMRQINWAEVKERRREEEAMVGRNREAEEELNRRLDEAGAARDEAMPQTSGPQLREVNGQIMLVQDSGTIDRQAEADRDIEMMETVEEDDLTARVTSRSFMKNNKRFPNDFLLPGQGKRWTTAATEEFYKGLSMFGTDFQIISTMFPGTTRRSIKTKFVREERLHPERVKQALHGQLDMNWDYYLHAAQLKDEAFVDADEVKRQLEEQEEQHQLELAAAKDVAEEERRQRRLAGIESENEDAGDKENGKGKKKKKEKGSKQVTFEHEDGVEVLGNVDDDPNWLQQQ